jgi:hypothetical protein
MEKEKLISMLESFKQDKLSIDVLYEYIIDNSCDCNSSCNTTYCYGCDCDNEDCFCNK